MDNCYGSLLDAFKEFSFLSGDSYIYWRDIGIFYSEMYGELIEAICAF